MNILRRFAPSDDAALHNAGNAQLRRTSLGAGACAVPTELRHFIALSGRKEQVLFQAVLLGVELEITSLGRKQLVVGAALDNAAGFNHQDLIGATNGG